MITMSLMTNADGCMVEMPLICSLLLAFHLSDSLKANKINSLGNTQVVPRGPQGCDPMVCDAG